MSSSPATRESLMLRLRDHDDTVAWDEFVRIYSPMIHRIARARGLQDADASEIVQDVLVAIVKSLPSFQRQSQTGSFRRWLTTIARNKTLNRLMRQPIDVSKRVEHSDIMSRLSEQSNAAAANSDQQLELEWKRQMFVMAAADVRTRVQPTTWSAFWMTAVEEQPGENVAKELGISIGSVYVARSRVLAKIREWVHQHSSTWETDQE